MQLCDARFSGLFDIENTTPTWQKRYQRVTTPANGPVMVPARLLKLNHPDIIMVKQLSWGYQLVHNKLLAS